MKEFEGFFVNVPESEEFDPVFFVLKDFLFKLRNMLGSPVVGGPFQPEPNQHLGPLFRRTLACIKRNNAPRNEVCPQQVLEGFPFLGLFAPQLTK